MEIEFLYLVAELGNGGQERQLFYLNQTMEKYGKKTVVAVWDFDEKDKYVNLLKEASIAVLNLKKYGSIWNKTLFLRKYILCRRVKIVHSFSFHLNFIAFLSCLFTSCRPIGGIRSSLQNYKSDMSILPFYLSCFTPKCMISNNKKFNSQFRLKFLHQILNRVHIVENALNISQFNIGSPPRRKFLKMVSIGSLYPVKRIDILIKVTSMLKQKGVYAIHYHAGTGPLESALKRQVNEMHLAENFIFSNNTENIPQFLADADLFIHSAAFEGYPNVIMEAMASGKAIISTDCGDIYLLVEDGVNGFVVPVNDIEKLTERVIYLINNPEKRKEMGMAGRKKAETLFSIEAFRKKTLMVYHQLNQEICVE